MDVIILAAELKQYGIHLLASLRHDLFGAYQHFFRKHIATVFCKKDKVYIVFKNATAASSPFVHFNPILD